MTTGSDEQRPAPQLVSGSIEFATPEEASAAFDRLKQLWMPAPESLPVGTDALCVTCGHMEGFHHRDQELDLDGRPLGKPYDSCFGCVQDDVGRAAWHAYAPAPVGTDSARAEAERRYSSLMTIGDYGEHNIDNPAYDAFIAGAEWARAEERKARGE